LGSWTQKQVEWRQVRPFVVYGVAPALLAAALFKALLLTQQYGYDIADSGAYDVIAWKLSRGWHLYRDLQTMYMPGLHWLEAVVFRLFHPDAYWGKAIGPLTLIPVSVLLYFMTLRWAHPILAVGAGLYLGAIGPGYYPGHVWLLAGVLLLAAPAATGSARGRLALGAVFSLALLNKLEVGIVGCAGGLAGLAALWWMRRERAGPRLWPMLWPALAGMAALPLLWVLWLAARGDLPDAYYCLVRMPLGWGRVLARQPWPGVLGPGGLPLISRVMDASHGWDFYAGLALCPAVAALVAVRLRRGTARLNDALIAALAVAGGLLLVLSMTEKDTYHLHSARIPMLPLEALVVALSVGWLRGRRNLAPGVLGLAFVASVWAWRLTSYANYLVFPLIVGIPDADAPVRLANWRPARVEALEGLKLPPEEAARYEQLVAYLDANLRPGERFFEMPGAPGLYFLSRRDPPTRFLWFNPGMVDQAGERRIIRDLERHRVRLVVFDKPPDQPYLRGVSARQDTPVLVGWILEHYRLRGAIGGCQIYWRRSAAGGGTRTQEAAPGRRIGTR